MNWKTWTTALVASVVLTACGGGGGETPPFNVTAPGNNPGGSPTSSSASAIDVSTSSLELGTGLGDKVTITALVKGPGSVIMAEEPVTLTTSSGTLVVSSAETDEAGSITATLSAGNLAADKTNRTITVTATSGTAVGTVTVLVRGSSASVAGPTSYSAGGTPGDLTVLVTDSKGAVVPGATVTASASTIGNGLSASSASTNSSGTATFTYTPTNAGSDTIVFSVLGATVSAALTVSGQDFAFTSPAASTQVTVGASQTVTVRYRLGGVAQVNRTVTFASTAGTFSTPTSVTTDGSGQASATLSSTFAGVATVSATISGVGTTTLPLSFVAITPANIVVQASPSIIAPNAVGSLGQQSTIVARITDSNGNPVASQTVNFTRDADPSGGNLSAPSAMTDSNGEATVNYISGPRATAIDEVQITATAQAVPSVHGTTRLTVNQRALFIALGTSNTISNLTVGGVVDESVYVKPWSVYVTDASGAAVPNVRLTLRILPVSYGKGSLIWVDPSYVYSAFGGAQDGTQTLPAGNVLWCANEDLDYDGVLDAGEDINGNGLLDPGNVIALAPNGSTVTTDANGRATINLQYAESYAKWVVVTLRATAIVAGTESTRDVTFSAQGMSSDFTVQAAPPAAVDSPFGWKAACTTAN